MRSEWSARLAWTVTAVALVADAVSLAMLIVVNGGVAPVPPLFGDPSGEVTAVVAGLGAATVAVIAVVGGLLAARRPRNPIGWLLAGCGVSGAGFYLASQHATAALVTRPGALPAGVPAAWLAGWLWLAAFGSILYVLMLFPDGRLPSRRWRPLGWLVGGVLAVLALLVAVAPGPLGGIAVDNPFGLPFLGAVAARTDDVAVVVWLTLPAVAFASLLVRYRGCRGAQRQQMKYLVVASVLLLAAVTVQQAGVLPGPLAYGMLFLAAVSLPVAVTAAVLRYRLYDIDRIVSRTVSYAILTLLLVTGYVAAVFGLQQLLRPITGDSQLAVAGATLVVAAGFQPARRRVQQVVDRRFARARYDARRTVERFRGRLRDEVDLDHLCADLTDAVRTTVQPAAVTLWLRTPDHRR